MLENLLPQESWGFALILVRVSAIMMLFPLIGQAIVPVRIRLLLTVAIAIVLAPAVSARLPPLPETLSEVLVLVLAELLVGLLIGTVARFAVDSLTYAGAIVAYLSGLSNAALFNPLQSQQSILPSVFLNLMGVTLLFATSLHHLLFMDLAESYEFFTPGMFYPAGDFTMVVVQALAASFEIGIKMAIPFLVIQTLFMVLLGVMARLMPQMPVFFVALPLQILLGLVILSLILGSVAQLFLMHFQESLTPFLA